MQRCDPVPPKTTLRAQSGQGRKIYDESEEGVARRIIHDELKRADCSAANLALRAKGNVLKVRIARRLRRETALTLQRIAELLHMGTPT